MSGGTKTHILMVEDNPGDVELLRLALRTAGIDCELTVIADGREALLYVQQYEAGGRRPPDLAILDLNVPKNDGIEILEAIRVSALFAALPVVVLTSSSSPRETQKLQSLGISRHVSKPLELEEFMKIGTTVREVLETAALP